MCVLSSAQVVLRLEELVSGAVLPLVPIWGFGGVDLACRAGVLMVVHGIG